MARESTARVEEEVDPELFERIQRKIAAEERTAKLKKLGLAFGPRETGLAEVTKDCHSANFHTDECRCAKLPGEPAGVNDGRAYRAGEVVVVGEGDDLQILHGRLGIRMLDPEEVPGAVTRSDLFEIRARVASHGAVEEAKRSLETSISNKKNQLEGLRVEIEKLTRDDLPRAAAKAIREKEHLDSYFVGRTPEWRRKAEEAAATFEPPRSPF